MIIEYEPLIDVEGSNNIMLELLSKYLPADQIHHCENGFIINGGWIPFDMKEREKMYPKAFRDLAKYITDF